MVNPDIGNRQNMAETDIGIDHIMAETDIGNRQNMAETESFLLSKQTLAGFAAQNNEKPFSLAPHIEAVKKEFR